MEGGEVQCDCGSDDWVEGWLDNGCVEQGRGDDERGVGRGTGLNKIILTP